MMLIWQIRRIKIMMMMSFIRRRMVITHMRGKTIRYYVL